MDRRTEIRDFLSSRRARIKPEQAGLKPSPLAGARRVAGLRREEVALLAGVSVPYYTRLERGDARGATDAVLNAISRAQHEVRRHRAGAKRVNHPLVGQLTFNYETMELAADEGLYVIVCAVAPGSRDADALDLLASWTAPENARDTTLNQAGLRKDLDGGLRVSVADRCPPRPARPLSRAGRQGFSGPSQ